MIKSLALGFLAISILGSVSFAAPRERDNCRTEGLYRDKSNGGVTRYRGHSLEKDLVGCMQYVASIVDWATDRYVPTTTRWDYSSQSIQANGTLRPGNGSRMMPVCELAEYDGNGRNARLVKVDRFNLGFARCLERAERLELHRGRNGFTKFTYTAGGYVATGLVNR